MANGLDSVIARKALEGLVFHRFQNVGLVGSLYNLRFGRWFARSLTVVTEKLNCECRKPCASKGEQ